MSSNSNIKVIEKTIANEECLIKQSEKYSVYVLTWNVGSRLPENISLRQLLGLQTVDEQHQLPDIYAIGLQEVNIQPHQKVRELFKSDPWTYKIKQLLRDYNYVMVKTEQMQGILLTIAVLRKHIEHLHDIEAEFTRTGFGGIWGNKGAVSVRFTLYGCGLAFVVAHLAAHDHHLDERIEDYKQIMENHHYHVDHYREIFDHEYVFWFGDLNFRLKGDDSATEVRDIANGDEKQLAQLFKRDQLVYIREKTQQAFHLMSESVPAFQPTFKYKEGTSEYDLKRRPAWTDRILYAVQTFNRQTDMQLSIEQHSYISYPAYTISDHKPVASEFTILLYPNIKTICIQFKPIDIWKIREENTVVYIKPQNFEERGYDWIGIFPANYASLTDYVAYEYVTQTDSSSSHESSTDDQYFEISRPHRRGHRRNVRLLYKHENSEDNVCLNFSDDLDLHHNKQYILIYFQSTGLRGVTNIAGMSNVFTAVKQNKIKSTEYQID